MCEIRFIVTKCIDRGLGELWVLQAPAAFGSAWRHTPLCLIDYEA
jgi:hypothetical protein